MNYLTTKDADTLRNLLDENPGLPIVFVTKPDGSLHNSCATIEALDIELGKILDDEDLIKDETAVITDEGLRMQITGDWEEYDSDPEEYMRKFSEAAQKYKKEWQPAIIVHMDVVNQDADEERDW